MAEFNRQSQPPSEEEEAALPEGDEYVGETGVRRTNVEQHTPADNPRNQEQQGDGVSGERGPDSEAAPLEDRSAGHQSRGAS